jgi:hypothetical protein
LVVAFFRTCLVAAQPAIRHQLLTLKKTRPWWVQLFVGGSFDRGVEPSLFVT